MKAPHIIIILFVALLAAACGSRSKEYDFELRAVQIEKKPLGDGWMLLSAQLALANTSDAWQAIDVTSGTIRCKEECYYQVRSLADTSDSSRSQQLTRFEQSGIDGYIDVSTGHILIPPGFQVLGRVDQNGQTPLINSMELKVGEGTSDYSGQVEEFQGWNLVSDPVGDRIEEGWQVIDLSNRVPFTSPIIIQKKDLEIHEVGDVLQLQSGIEAPFRASAVRRTGDSLAVDYSLQNPSKTDAAWYKLGLYIIGNDGLIRTCETESPDYSFWCLANPMELSPGPGQTTTGTRNFSLPSSVNELYLVAIVTGFTSSFQDAFVYKL